jgi:hypothetical protein
MLWCGAAKKQGKNKLLRLRALSAAWERGIVDGWHAQFSPFDVWLSLRFYC